jgi:tripartite-type tricarboxylate transporter receptor subunit TctC
MRFGFFLVLSLSAAAAWSQAYPSKPVRVVVPYPAGSTPDIIGRALELGLPQLESLAWNGLLAPAGTPAAVISRLSAETVNAMGHPQTREALGRQGFDVVASSPEEFARWIRAESEKWARVIRASGARVD